MTDSQISLPVPELPAPGTGRCQPEVSGPVLGEVPEPLTFAVHGHIPVGQGAIRTGATGKSYHANGKILKPWRALVTAAAVEATGRHAYVPPKRPKGQKPPPAICVTCGTPKNRHGLYLGAIALRIVVSFPKPKSAPGRRFASVGGLGDFDHHARSISDALTGVIYADDAQIVSGHIEKTYAGNPGGLSVPGAEIRIWELAP